MTDQMWVWDRPVWRDWLFWLTAIAVIAVVPAQPTAFDAVFAACVQIALFGLLPGSIRRTIRHRRAS